MENFSSVKHEHEIIDFCLEGRDSLKYTLAVRRRRRRRRGIRDFYNVLHHSVVSFHFAFKLNHIRQRIQ